MSIKKYLFHVINIKLISDKTKEEKLQIYDSLIKHLTEKKKFSRVSDNEAIVFNPYYEKKIGDIKFYYGYICKGISFFDKDEISVLEETLGKEKTNKNKMLSPKITEYCYIPSIHRLAFIKQNKKASLKEIESHLNQHLTNFVQKPDKLIIQIEKEQSIIEEIFNAKAIYKLSYKISYSNNDALNAQGELFDIFLKENNITTLDLSASSEHGEKGMNVENVPFLGGGLEVAKKNGVIKNAEILTNEGITKKLNNKNIPSLYEFKYDEDIENQKEEWAKKLISIYNKIKNS